MSEFYKKYEKYLAANNLVGNKVIECKNTCPTIVILTFSIVNATVAEVNVVGTIVCPVPDDGDPVTPFIQCLISQGFDLIAFTQGGIDNNFVTYTFVDC